MRRLGQVKHSPNSAAGLVAIQRGPALLDPHRATLNTIRATVGVPGQHWRLLYQPLFSAYAELVQSLPASEAHHHCDQGGLLRHGLEVVEIALKLRRGHVLPPGKEPEQVAEEQDVWTYAVATAALLHDIGKPLVDQIVTLCGRDGLPSALWSPWVGAMTATPAKHYRLEFRRGRKYRLHGAVAPLLAPYLIPKDGLRWLGAHPDALAAWVAAATGGAAPGPVQSGHGQSAHAVAVIGEIVSKADQLSAGADLAGGRRQVPGAQVKPLAERLVVELRQLLEDKTLPINRAGAAAFVDETAIWLVSKRCLDALRDRMIEQGQSDIPKRNDRLMDELQERGYLTANAEGKAVWTCQITVGEGEQAWSHALTVLRMPIECLWADRDARPEGAVVTVVPQVTTQGESTDRSQSDGLPAVDEPSEDEPQIVVADVSTLLDTDDDTTAEGEEQPFGQGPKDRAHIRASSTPAADTATDNDIDAGEAFVVWLIDGLKSGSLAINTSKARVHVVEEGLFLVSPAIFRSFGKENWLKAQKRFLKLKLTARTDSGENIFHYTVNGDRGKKTIKGMLIEKPRQKLAIKLPEPNSILSPKEPG